MGQVDIDQIIGERAENEQIGRVVEETDGRGAEVVIASCSSGRAHEQALEMVCARGRINLFGSLPKGNSTVNFDSNLVHYKECCVSGTHGSAPRQNKLSLRLISKGIINTGDLITRRVPLADFMEAMTAVGEGKDLKVIVVTAKG